MSSVKGTPANWKQFLYDVLAMVEQLGMPTYFLTLSCADLIWEKLPYIINILNNVVLKDEELKILSYYERCDLLNKTKYLKILRRANSLIANDNIRRVILEIKTIDVKSSKYEYFVLFTEKTFKVKKKFI